jgi:hypothetical protein
MGRLDRAGVDRFLCRLRPAELAMARELRRWGLATLVACALVALGYLPPRGGVTVGESRFAPRIPKPTPARLRAQGLAEEWRSAQAAITLEQSERNLAGDLSARPRAGTGFTLVVDGPDSVASLLKPFFTAQLDTVWRQLGLGETKISVLLVVATPIRRRSGGDAALPAEDRGGAATYVLPDSSNRTTCAALIPSSYFTLNLLRTKRMERVNPFREWLKGGLGPCAFYAAYGTPGKPARRWLAHRGYDLALYPGWDKLRSDRSAFGFDAADLRRYSWYWEWIYRLPPPTVACLAGRAGACGETVLSGSGGGFEDTLPRVLTVQRRWWQTQSVVPGERYLGDVARDIGRDRFLRFWNSTEPVDTALAAALKEPVGDWTARWERRFVPELPLGPAAPASATVLATLLAAAAVATVSFMAVRRQVR